MSEITSTLETLRLGHERLAQLRTSASLRDPWTLQDLEYGMLLVMARLAHMEDHPGEMDCLRPCPKD